VILQQLLNGIGIGLTYALVALGFNLAFGVMRVLNLAFGEVFMLGAVVSLAFVERFPAYAGLAPAVAVLAAVGAGLLVHRLAVAPLGRVSELDSPRHLGVMITTIGAALVMQNAAILVFGAYPRRFPPLLPDVDVGVGPVQVRSVILLDLAAAAAAMLLLAHVIQRTRFGLRLRAIADDPELAAATGVRIPAHEAAAVALSSALAGLAAFLTAQTVGAVSPYFGVTFGFKGLVVVILGGLGSFRGTVVAGLALGVLEALAAGFVSSSYRDAVAFGLLLAYLLWRGHLGRGTRRAPLPAEGA
jgi:branched-chain amino acid transport system permease protein